MNLRKNLLSMTAAAAIAGLSVPVLAQEVKTESPKFGNLEFKVGESGIGDSEATIQMKDGRTCVVYDMGSGKMSKAAGMFIISFYDKHQRDGIVSECIKDMESKTITHNMNPSTKGHFFNNDYAEVAKSYFGQFLREEFVKTVKKPNDIDFEKWDGIARFLSKGFPWLSPESLVGEYRRAEEFIFSKQNDVRDFLEKVEANKDHYGEIPNLTHGSELDTNVRFLLRRVMDMGYNSKNFMGGIDEIKIVERKYEAFLKSKLSL